MRSTDRGIAEICFQAGFNNVSNFNRQFLLHRGTTPSSWRRAVRQSRIQAGTQGHAGHPQPRPQAA